MSKSRWYARTSVSHKNCLQNPFLGVLRILLQGCTSSSTALQHPSNFPSLLGNLHPSCRKKTRLAWAGAPSHRLTIGFQDPKLKTLDSWTTNWRTSGPQKGRLILDNSCQRILSTCFLGSPSHLHDPATYSRRNMIRDSERTIESRRPAWMECMECHLGEVLHQPSHHSNQTLQSMGNGKYVEIHYVLNEWFSWRHPNLNQNHMCFPLKPFTSLLCTGFEIARLECQSVATLAKDA